MCYTTSSVIKVDTIQLAFDAYIKDTDFKDYFTIGENGAELRMYHINGFTFGKIPVLTNAQPKLVQGYNWGLIPSWIQDQKSAFDFRKFTLNAKAETLFEKPAFKDAAKTNRCLILVSGFFEWKTVGKDKIPHYIYCPNMPIMALAGLYSTWLDPISKEIHNTTTIITTHANELMEVIHNEKKRMPVILPTTQISTWLNPQLTQNEASELLTPFDSNQMKAHEVSKLISSPHSSNNPDVLKPYNNFLF